jgi:hypothetical protein
MPAGNRPFWFPKSICDFFRFVAAGSHIQGGSAAGGTRMIIEMRTYKLMPGKWAEFIEIFRSRSMPAL